MSELGKSRYLNPGFEESWWSKDYARRCRASGLAYDVSAMIATAQVAVEDDCSGIPMDQRGIGSTLAVAGRIAGDLIEECEMLEKRIAELEN